MSKIHSNIRECQSKSLSSRFPLFLLANVSLLIYAPRSPIQTTVSSLSTVCRLCSTSRYRLRNGLFFAILSPSIRWNLKTNIILDLVVSVTIVSVTLTLGIMSLTTWSWMTYHGTMVLRNVKVFRVGETSLRVKVILRYIQMGLYLILN